MCRILRPMRTSASTPLARGIHGGGFLFPPLFLSPPFFLFPFHNLFRFLSSRAIDEKEGGGLGRQLSVSADIFAVVAWVRSKVGIGHDERRWTVDIGNDDWYLWVGMCTDGLDELDVMSGGYRGNRP